MNTLRMIGLVGGATVAGFIIGLLMLATFYALATADPNAETRDYNRTLPQSFLDRELVPAPVMFRPKKDKR